MAPNGVELKEERGEDVALNLDKDAVDMLDRLADEAGTSRDEMVERLIEEAGSQ